MPIIPEQFWTTSEEKTRLNWFTYEVALSFEDAIEINREDAPAPKFVKKADVAPLAVALANRFKAEYLRAQAAPPRPVTMGWGSKKLKSLSRARPRTRGNPPPRLLKFSPQWIVDEIPKLAGSYVAEDLAEDMVDALDGLLDTCATCDTQCLAFPDAPCTMFDEGPLGSITEERGDSEIFSVPIPGLIQWFNDWLLGEGVQASRKELGQSSKKQQLLELGIHQDHPALAPPLLLNASGEPAVFQLKITLRYLKPPVWRRVLILSTATFADLHDAIQESFGWANYHLHEFSVKRPRPFRGEVSIAGLPPGGDMASVADFMEESDYREDQVQLANFLSPAAPRATYTYDFGDNWDHLILLEKVLPVDPAIEYPTCVKEKGRTPPEDSGGPWGYMEDGEDDLDS